MHGDHDMGHSVAGWTGTATGLIGTTGMGVAFAARSTIGLLLGGAVVVLAVLTTWVLHLAGWGKPTGPRSPVPGLRHNGPGAYATPRPARSPQLSRLPSVRPQTRDCCRCHLVGARG